MNKKIIVIIGIILFIICNIIVYINGKVAYPVVSVEKLKNISIKCDDKNIDYKYKIKNDIIHFEVTPIKPGKAVIQIEGEKKEKGKIKKEIIKKTIYVHNSGIVTQDNYFGYCNGDLSFVITYYIMLILIIIYLIKELKSSIKNKLYSYKNARLFGLLVFIIIPTIFNIFLFIYDLYYGYHKTLNELMTELKDYIYLFLLLIFPLAFILTILVTISNIKLLKKEGKRWNNMLGIILGSFFNIATLTVAILNFSSNNIVLIFISGILTLTITYIEYMFIGTCILGIICAKHIPKFDKDAIIILGCKIKEDGTLTNLLKARTDTAIKISKMQKEHTNKDIIFIPSGGKGIDEIMPEGLAIKNYLIKQGIKEKNILIEDKSKNTYQNISYSNKLIKEKIKKPKLAFSTTNYHVFRAGIIGTKQKLDIEGIGAKTKSYYWINAFIREFIATLVTEKRKHIETLIIFLLLLIVFNIITFI